MKGEILESVQQVVQFGFVVYHSHDTGPALVRLDQETWFAPARIAVINGPHSPRRMIRYRRGRPVVFICQYPSGAGLPGVIVCVSWGAMVHPLYPGHRVMRSHLGVTRNSS